MTRSAAAEAVRLRPVVDDDHAFLLRVYASTRETEFASVPFTAEQKAVFFAQQFDAQSRHYLAHYPGASFDVILAGDEPVGRLVVWRGSSEVRLVDIAILTASRRRGIGACVLDPVLAEAAALGVPAVLHVDRSNEAAQRFYAGLGFAPTGEEAGGVLLRFERPAPVPDAAGCGADQPKTTS